MTTSDQQRFPGGRMHAFHACLASLTIAEQLDYSQSLLWTLLIPHHPLSPLITHHPLSSLRGVLGHGRWRKKMDYHYYTYYWRLLSYQKASGKNPSVFLPEGFRGSTARPSSRGGGRHKHDCFNLKTCQTYKIKMTCSDN